MPNYLSEVELPGGAEYQFKDLQTRANLGLEGNLMSKTYTGVIATANNQADGNLYAIKILPDDYDGSWSIFYRVTATITGVSEANGLGYQESYIYVDGARNVHTAYRVWNNIRHSSYRPFYYHTFYGAKSAGVTNGYGHVMGIGLRSSWNPTTTANSRTVTFEILDYRDCTVSFFDSMTKYASIPGTGSTNYDALTEFNGSTAGRTQTGDVNTHDRSQFQNNIFKCGSTAIAANNIIVGDVDGLYHHLKLGTPFDIRYPIFYTFNAASANAYLTSVYVDVPFTVTTTQSLTLAAQKPVFIKGQLSGTIFTPVSATPLTQTLPTSADGYEYIRLGFAYSTTNMQLEQVHPIFAYRNGKLVQIVGDADTVNGHTVASDVPSDAKFTDTTYESKAAVSGGTDVSLVTTGEKYLWNNSSGGGSTPEIFIGTCSTAAGTKDKAVTLNDATGFSLKPGVIVAVKFTHTNTYSSSTSNPVTLNVNGTGAKNIWYNTAHSGSGNTGTNTNVYGFANRYAYYIYDGTYWAWINHDIDNDTNKMLPYCTTGAGTAAKVVACAHYKLLANSYIPVVIENNNTASSALTLNINSKGAKPIYINGSASSSSNHTLPGGTYLVFYDGTNYYFRTDGLIQGVTAVATKNDTTLATTAYVTRAITTLDEEIAAALAQI